MNEVAETKQAGDQAAAAAPRSALPADALIIVPARSMVLFPGTVLPITISRPRSVAAAQQAVRDQKQVGILMQREPDVTDPVPIDLHRVGTVANQRVRQAMRAGIHRPGDRHAERLKAPPAAVLNRGLQSGLDDQQSRHRLQSVLSALLRSGSPSIS